MGTAHGACCVVWWWGRPPCLRHEASQWVLEQRLSSHASCITCHPSCPAPSLPSHALPSGNSVRMSALALLKMAMHARSGGNLEVILRRRAVARGEGGVGGGVGAGRRTLCRRGVGWVGGQVRLDELAVAPGGLRRV